MGAATSHATFRALGSEVYVGVRRPAELDRALAVTRAVLRDVDEVASRFRDSDLTRVNAQPGQWVAVDPLLVAAVQVGREAARQTDGLVSPLLGRVLVEVGYDRDFALIEEGASGSFVRPEPPPLDAWREICTDPGGWVRIPEHTALDLGATGKAWAADLVAAALTERLACSAIVGVGGDVRVAAPDGVPWPVVVAERPGGPAEELTALAGGGLATSTTTVRRWARAGVRHHHLLDPRTGLPTTGAWRTVTAAGATCVAANTASTAAIVMGDAATGWLEDHAVSARLVGRRGAVARTGAWPRERSAA
ncbi:FAD:protein FMN transferase [uncultured Nocardioides sp.]|uniref:FAD:protein FMN transferase n=1 Tax=uncultured Nocardioides sp. TaxID=198441 RepID=UPI00260BCCEC|nr:FAD:protein FMN transferase [uncultured Nocardioides sp.]